MQFKDTSNISRIIVNQTPPVPFITQISDTLFSSSSNGNQWYSYLQGLIPGAVESFYLPQQTDNYYVKIKINNCIAPNKSNVLYFNNSGIDNQNNIFNLSISPNPFSEYTEIQYELKDEQFVEFSVFDIAGKEILKPIYKLQNKGIQSEKINASELNAGLYLYKIQIGSKIQIGKLIRY